MQMGTIRAQIILDRLLITNVQEYFLEHSHH